MENKTYHIIFNIKTCTGFESYARFFIGIKKEFAEAIFSKLKGNKEVDENAVLTLDMVETINNLPINMEVLSCSLEEMGENCKTVTKEMFRNLNLEEM